jgi:hypothetical protein
MEDDSPDEKYAEPSSSSGVPLYAIVLICAGIVVLFIGGFAWYKSRTSNNYKSLDLFFKYADDYLDPHAIDKNLDDTIEKITTLDLVSAIEKITNIDLSSIDGDIPEDLISKLNYNQTKNIKYANQVCANLESRLIVLQGKTADLMSENLLVTEQNSTKLQDFYEKVKIACGKISRIDIQISPFPNKDPSQNDGSLMARIFGR